MEKLYVVVFILAFFWVHGEIANGARTQDGSEAWGYVEVRPSKQNFPDLNFLI